MTRRLTTLLAVMAVCAGALALTASANAARGMEVALQDDATFLFLDWHGGSTERRTTGGSDD